MSLRGAGEAGANGNLAISISTLARPPHSESERVCVKCVRVFDP